MQADVKTKNRKKLKVKVLVDSGCTHTGINEQLVKDKRIQMKSINFSFEVFNADGMKNGEMTRVAVKFTNSGLSFSLFYFSFLFSFCFIFLFSIFKTIRVRVD